ncbi:hypothetical protein D3C78_636150 [compost metagenome]
MGRQRAAQGWQADLDRQVHADTQRAGIFDGADRYLPGHLAGLHVDGGQGAERWCLARDAGDRQEAVLVHRIRGAFERYGAHAGVQRFTTASGLAFVLRRDHLDPQAQAHIVDEDEAMDRVGGNAAPVHATQRTGEAQRQVGARCGVQAVVAHLLEVDTAQQLVIWRGAPHVRLGQGLCADLWHAHRFRLGRGVRLVRDVAWLDRNFVNLGKRLAGGAVEHVDLPGLGADHHRRNRLAVVLGEVDQARLHRQVEVPQVVVHGLEHPLLVAGGGVQGQHRSAVGVVQLAALDTVDVGGRGAHRQEHGVHRRVVGHRRPAVRGAAHIGAAVGRSVAVLRVARVERPAHGTGEHVEATDHAAWHVGLDVVGDTAAYHHGGTGHQRCGRQLVVGVRYVTQAGHQVDLAIVAEALAELTSVGVDCDQPAVDGVGQQATLAVGASRYATDGYRRAVWLSWLGHWRGSVEVGHATATLPHFGLGVDLVFPQLFAGVGIEGDQVVVRGADEHLVANLQRGQLVFGTVAIADGDVTGAVGPGDLELVDVVAVDLVQCSEAAATFGIAIVGPVLLLLAGFDRGHARAFAGRRDAWMGNEHVARSDHQHHGQHAGDAVGTTASATAIGTYQLRVDERHHHADSTEHEQAREQRPEHQAGIDQCPQCGADQECSVQPGTGFLASGNEYAGDGHGQAADQEVPRAAKARELDAAGSQEEAEQGDDHAQADQDDVCGARGARCFVHARDLSRWNVRSLSP